MYTSLQSSLMNSTKFISDELVLEQNCKNRMQVTAQLKSLLSAGKKTIFLFTTDKSMGKLLVNIGKWLLGATLNRGKKFEYSVADSTIKYTPLNLSENMCLQIMQSNEGRVIGIDFSKSDREQRKDIENSKAAKQASRQKSKCIGEIIYYLNIIKQLINETQIVYYTIINGINEEEKTNQQINKVQHFICNDWIRLILCEYQTSQNQRNDIKKLFIDGANKSMSKFVLPELFANLQKKPILSEFIDKKLNKAPNSPNKSNEANEIKAKLSQIRIQATHCQRLFLNPIRKIIQNTESESQHKNAKLYQQRIKQAQKFVEYTKPQVNSKYQCIQNFKLSKYDQSIAYKYFVTKTIEIKNKYKALQSNKASQLANLRNFFLQLICEIYNATSISQNQIKSLQKYVKCLLQINENLLQIDPSILPMYSTVLDAIKYNQDSRQKLAKIIANMSVQHQKQPLYYKLYLEMIQSYDRMQWGKQPEQNRLVAKFTELKTQIPIIQKMATLYSACQLKQTICQVIKQIFAQYFIQGHMDASYKFDLFMRGFVGSAKKLQSFGLPQLAIQVYKKLKFTKKVEECIRQMIFKESGEKEKSQIYLEISDYFYSIGQVHRALHYAELAYENSNTAQHSQIQKSMNKMIEMRRKVLKNQYDPNCKQAKLVQSLSKHEADIKMYFDYEFSEQFKQKINIIETLVQDSELDTTIAVKNDELREMQFV